jgi:hypothetical protein
MPSLIGVGGATGIAANYLKAAPSTKFGTRELVHALITINNVNLYTNADLSDSNFSKAIRAIQTIAEIYAVGIPADTEGPGSSFTVILSADTLADDNYGQVGDFDTNNNSTNLENVLNNLFDETVNVTYTVMFGLAYD